MNILIMSINELHLALLDLPLYGNVVVTLNLPLQRSGFLNLVEHQIFSCLELLADGGMILVINLLGFGSPRQVKVITQILLIPLDQLIMNGHLFQLSCVLIEILNEFLGIEQIFLVLSNEIIQSGLFIEVMIDQIALGDILSGSLILDALHQIYARGEQIL